MSRKGLTSRTEVGAFNIESVYNTLFAISSWCSGYIHCITLCKFCPDIGTRNRCQGPGRVCVAVKSVPCLADGAFRLCGIPEKPFVLGVDGHLAVDFNSIPEQSGYLK